MTKHDDFHQDDHTIRPKNAAGQQKRFLRANETHRNQNPKFDFFCDFPYIIFSTKKSILGPKHSQNHQKIINIHQNDHIIRPQNIARQQKCFFQVNKTHRNQNPKFQNVCDFLYLICLTKSSILGPKINQKSPKIVKKYRFSPKLPYIKAIKYREATKMFFPSERNTQKPKSKI